jgi:hypothetical protein
MNKNPISKRRQSTAILAAAHRELENLSRLAGAFREIEAAVQAAPAELRARLYSAGAREDGGLLRPISYDA